MNDELAASDVYLEPERFDDLARFMGSFLYQNCLKTLSLLGIKGYLFERKQIP